MVQVKLRGPCRSVRVRMIKTDDLQLVIPGILFGFADRIWRNQEPIMLSVFFTGILRGIGLRHLLLTCKDTAEQQAATFMRVSGLSVLSNLLQMLLCQLNGQGLHPPRTARSSTSFPHRKAPSQSLLLAVSFLPVRLPQHLPQRRCPPANLPPEPASKPSLGPVQCRPRAVRPPHRCRRLEEQSMSPYASFLRAHASGSPAASK